MAVSQIHFHVSKAVACLFFLCSFVVNPDISNAQESPILRIVVNSAEDGNPLPGANVRLFSPDTDKMLYSCATDQDGFCEIRNIDSDRPYQLKITYVGFRPHTASIEMSPNTRRIVSVSLKPALSELGEVTVRDRRYITTGEAGIKRISPEDIARVPSPGVDGDLASYLQTQPGIITVGDRGGNLFIRGGTPHQNLILVDDMPIVKPFHISNLFSAFPDQIIQSADLYAGGFGAEYAGATSGVIDIKLRPGNKVDHQASAGVSPYLFSMLLEGPIEKNSDSYMFMARKSTIQQFDSFLTGKEIPINFYDAMGRYSLQRESISCNFTAMRTHDSGQIVPLRNIDHTWSNTAIGGRCLGFDQQFNYPIEASLGYSHYGSREGAPERTERESNLGQIFMNVDLRQTLFGANMDYGFGLNFQSYNTTLDERFTSLESFERKIGIVHLYSSFEWNPATSLIVKPGAASQITTEGQATFEPRLRISYQPGGTNKSEISASVGKYMQLMAGISDQRDVGTVFTVLLPAIKDEPIPRALHGILAYRQEIVNNFTGKIEGYIKKHENIHVSKWHPEVGLEIETALADGLAYGFDAQLTYQTPTLFASASYGWAKVEYEAASGDLGAWIQEPIFSYSPAHDQRHKLNTIVSYKFGKITANARWEFGTGRPYTRLFGFDIFVEVPDEDVGETNGTARTLFTRPYDKRLPYYHRLDISVERPFPLGPNWQLNAEVGAINSYDRNNIFSFDFHSLQRVDQTPLLPYISLKISKL